MKRSLLALLMLVGAPGSALACSCLPPPTETAEMQRLAREIARNAVALVEVDVRTAYDPARGLGELMRVRRTLAGEAPREFRVARSGAPSSASCDVEYPSGSIALLMIYPVEGGRGGPGEFTESGLCTSFLLRDARMQQMIVEAMRNRGGHNGGGEQQRPCRQSAPQA